MADSPLESIETDMPNTLETSCLTGANDTNSTIIAKAQVSNRIISERGSVLAMDASSSSPLPVQEPDSLPKKRGRPRKQSSTAVKGSRSPDITATPSRKRGRPLKSASKKSKSPSLNAPTSEDKRIMASIRRSKRENDKFSKKNFDNSSHQTHPKTTTTSSTMNGMPEHQGSAIGRMNNSIAFSSPAEFGRMAPAGFNTPYPRPSYGTGGNGIHGFHSSRPDPAIMAPFSAQCSSCGAVKSIIQDILFQHSIQEQDVWVIPLPAAVEMHRYFGGGTPPPRKDVLISAEMVEMIRNLLFHNGSYGV
ncbi:hypothetical protein E8E14_003389 [Neopestalotiopsis sp. 37M]|nr:hypothetical protein E8E14_003389 [Neopestalotiopsis sp. 37M]